MFELERAVAAWRKQMQAGGVKPLPALDELEDHLRQAFARQIQAGLSEQRAFESAREQIGQAEPLDREFGKIHEEHWNMAWIAWALFAVSFFLPAYADGRGWQCAGLSAVAVSWPDFWKGDWATIHLALLTLANLLMLASPFLLRWLPPKPGVLKWLRLSTLAALLLVSSFLWLLLAHQNTSKDLKAGCYLWATSFLPLFLSTLKVRRCEAEVRHPQYV